MLVLAVGVATLVFTLLDHFKAKPKPTAPNENQPRSARPRASAAPSAAAGFAEAGKLLRSGLDESVDPCDDFYAFACNNYLDSHPIPQGAARVGTYDQAQRLVLDEVVAYLNTNVSSPVSETERTVRALFKTCAEHDQSTEDKTQLIQNKLRGWWVESLDCPTFETSHNMCGIRVMFKFWNQLHVRVEVFIEHALHW